MLQVLVCLALLGTANALSLGPQGLRHTSFRTSDGLSRGGVGASSPHPLGYADRTSQPQPFGMYGANYATLRGSRKLSMSVDSEEHNQDIPINAKSAEVVDGNSDSSNISNTLLKIGRIALPALAITAASLLYGQPAMAATSELYESLKAQVNDSGFLQAFLLIFVSEIGDKTFFIAGLLAAKYGRLISFTGSIGALGVMTVISTIIGQLFHAVPESLTKGVPYDDVLAVLAFSYFGLKTLYDSLQLEGGDNRGIEEEKAGAGKLRLKFRELLLYTGGVLILCGVVH